MDSKKMIIKRSFRKTITYKLFISYAILLLIAVTILLSPISTIIRDLHLNTLKKMMHNNTLVVEDHLKNDLKHIDDLQVDIRHFANLIKNRITIIDYDGEVLADSEVVNLNDLDNHLYRPEIQQAKKNKTGSSIRFSTSINMDMLYYSLKSDKIFIRVSKPLEQIFIAIQKIRKMIFIIGIIVLILCLIISFFISKKITSPIKESIQFSEEFAKGDFSNRILNYSDNEFGTLQISLNKLADNLSNYISKLITEQKKLSVTIESIEDAIAVIDIKGKIIIANKSFISLFKIKDSTVYKNYYEMIRSSLINKNLEIALKENKAFNFDEKLQSGEYCEIYINPIVENNSLQSILLVLQDVTARKRIDTIKTELVGNLSHELKTPLTIIKGYLETIELQIQNPELCNEFLQKALANVDRQNSIINDMLKLNMLETVNNFPKEKILIADIINNCLEILTPKYLKKAIKIEKKFEDKFIQIQGNKFLAEELFFNIIDNAINYNKIDGSISIISEKRDKFYNVIISDTGIGIPAKSMNRIFERFYRVDKGRSRTSGGTGLGLSIVKHAVDILGWKISVKQNKDNAGTSFTIEIPV